MGLFGEVGRLFQPVGATRAQSVFPPPDPRRRLFGDGGAGDILSGVGKLLAYGPFAGMVQNSINRRLDAQASPPRPIEIFATRAGSGRATHVPGAIGTPPFSQANALPPDAIEHLRRNPDLAPYFDAKYGSGAAARFLD